MRSVALGLSLLVLAGCADDGRLMNIRSSSEGPDEFAIVPTRPLQMPPSLAQLPPPTPQGANITDPTPRADAVVALGGNPARLTDQGIAASDAALVAYAGRQGVQSDIREITAAEDQQFRSRQGRRPLEVLGRQGVYYRAYRPQTLDSCSELDRWRPTGVQTPTAPPEP